MRVIQTELQAGSSQPFQIVQISDTHLTLADFRDGERKVTLANNRSKLFPNAEAVLRSAAELADRLKAPLVHTGDLIDFVSEANLEYVSDFMADHDCFACAGNHEFSLYVGEAREDAAYRAQSLDRVQKAFCNDIRMDSRVIHGVNFVALDDGYYLFEEQQLAFLKQQAAKGLPIVLLLHNPIYEEMLYDAVVNHREALGLPPSRSRCAYLTAVPEDKMAHYSPERFAQQQADEITRKTVEYFKSEPMIRAILTGHLHCNYEGSLTPEIPQIVTSNEDVRIITIR